MICYNVALDMSEQATTSKQHDIAGNLKLGLFNAENLFLLFDQPIPPHFQKLTEPQWQKLSASVYENKPIKKCLEIAEIIQSENPDIFMLCEVGGFESLKSFNQLFLDDKYIPALIEGNSDRNIDVGFLIKKDRGLSYTLQSHKNRPLNFLYPHENLSKKTGYPVNKESQFFSRDCSQLSIQSAENGATLLLILLTHLKSRLDPEKIDPGGTERRSAELRTCVDIIKELELIHPNVPIIFAGDLNGYAGRPNTDPEFSLLYSETELEDVLDVAGLSIEKRSTFFQVKNGKPAEGKQIDYCFISKQLKKILKKDSAYVFKYKDQFGFSFDIPRTLDDKLKLPSDHYPIFFALEKLPF
jgi:hypothetical protein